MKMRRRRWLRRLRAALRAARAAWRAGSERSTVVVTCFVSEELLDDLGPAVVAGLMAHDIKQALS